MKQRLLTLVVAMLMVPMALLARNYDISFSGDNAETALQAIKKATGYEFVYNKSVLNGTEKLRVYGSFKDMSLEQILNRVVSSQLGLDFEVIDKTIVLSPMKSSHAFKTTVTGQVTDENGDPLAGATVTVPGTKAVAATDIDGQFTLLVEGKNPHIEVSYVGMKPVTVKVDPKKPYIFIPMELNPTLMNEVVVTGYQNLKRENATGAYQTVTAEDFERSFTGTMADRLEGKVPGLVTYNNGDGQKISIRGVGTLHANSEPLVVVDGLPIEGGIETVNTYDIENITVLKDAAAASIYGARAANGVIVITTKRAHSDKVSIDFNTDITVTEKNNYDNYGWANAAEIIELERYNWDYMKNNQDQSAFNSLLNYYNNHRSKLTGVMRSYLDNYTGRISNAQHEANLNDYASNDYRSEYLDAFERARVQQSYNLAMRVQGRSLASSIVLNYNRDNLGQVGNHNQAITFKYRGDLKVAKWLDLAFGANVISDRSKTHYGREGINQYSPVRSLYNADGSLADMTEGVYDELACMSNSSYGLKSLWYNPLAEINMSPINDRNTNIRTYLQAQFNILPGWTASGMFQYEDIYSKNTVYREGNSFDMRYLYNSYTQEKIEMVDEWYFDDNIGDWNVMQVPLRTIIHNIPDGGRLDMSTIESAYWTFRAQTQFSRKLWEKHNIDAVAGFEYRDSHSKYNKTMFYGYDDQTQQNKNGFMNFGELYNMQGQAGVMGSDYAMYGAVNNSIYNPDFTSSDIIHRFYSLYANANYTYDGRYSVSGSWRIDKTDLFGADPKFRGRPLWSVGASWNAHNEAFLRDLTWIDALKPRLSYGLTGNIDSNASSYLTATIAGNDYIGNNMFVLDTPPNDQLRWEKTRTINVGVDFSFLGYRLSGSLDYYHKRGSDLLCMTDVDPTNGISSVLINNGVCVNRGIELQLNGRILEARSRNELGINAYLNLGYNHNKLVYVNNAPKNGVDALHQGKFHVGYPINSLFSIDYAGLQTIDGMQYMVWRDAQGNEQTSSLEAQLTPEDLVYSGSLDPKFVGTFTPEFTWKGFSLSGMFAYYGGHVMRVNNDLYTTGGSMYGYDLSGKGGVVPSSYLNYWRTGDDTKYLANGYASSFIANYSEYNSIYANTNVVHADYLKLRNIVLGYTLPPYLTRHAGINEARLRFQMTNVATWVRNSQGKDPEAINAYNGTNRNKAPRQYTFSLFLNF